MADKQHKAAITTNFDNLIADALAIYTRALPLVCGHESLTGFIRPNLQRPLDPQQAWFDSGDRTKKLEMPVNIGLKWVC